MLPGIGHFAILFALSRPLRGKGPVLEDAVQFIRAHPATSMRAEVAPVSAASARSPR
jgi:hypothetical protein